MTPQDHRSSFADLSREYETVTIGPLLWALTVELAGMIGHRYRPAEYNGGSPWDKNSIEELAQQTAVDLLIGEGQIDYIFTVADSIEDVRRLLTHNVKRALWRRRSPTLVDRLMARVREMASQSPFAIEQVGAQRWITIAADPGDPRELSDAELRGAAAVAHRVPRLIESETAERASMVYSPSTLRELLNSVIRETGGIFDRGLERLFKVLVTSWLPASLVSDEGSDSVSTDSIASSTRVEEGIEHQEMESAMQDLVGSMTNEDLTVFVCKAQGLSDSAVAERLGRSRRWVADRKKVVLSRTDKVFVDSVPVPLQDLAAARLVELTSEALGESL